MFTYAQCTCESTAFCKFGSGTAILHIVSDQSVYYHDLLHLAHRYLIVAIINTISDVTIFNMYMYQIFMIYISHDYTVALEGGPNAPVSQCLYESSHTCA